MRCRSPPSPRMVCTSCGIIGAFARPNWQERPSQELEGSAVELSGPEAHVAPGPYGPLLWDHLEVPLGAIRITSGSDDTCSEIGGCKCAKSFAISLPRLRGREGRGEVAAPGRDLETGSRPGGSPTHQLTGDLPMPVVEVRMRRRLREGIAGLADPVALHLSAREDLTQGTDLAFPSVMSRPTDRTS
jgi:hypothetical protein